MFLSVYVGNFLMGAKIDYIELTHNLRSSFEKGS